MVRRLLLAAVLCLSAVSAVHAADAKRPNIVVILADDMGFSDLGCYGSEIHTPNLDRLAAHGVRFTQFYNGARCCPTRSALLTGLYCHQAGVGHMVEDKGFPAYQGKLNDKCVTLAEVLKTAGYHTAMSGKWHVGEERPHWPVDRGFERSFSLISGASNYFRLDDGRKMALDDKPFKPEGDTFYMTDAITEHAVQFLDEHGNGKEPFFLYVAFTAPHWPLHAPPDEIAKYRGKYKKGWDELRAQRHQKQIELGIVEAKWPITPRDKAAPAWADVKEKDRDEWDLKMAVYAAQVDRLDQGVGKIVAKLKALGREENTLILFLSDNGGCAENIHRGKLGAKIGTPDSYDSYDLPWANASNTPFRLYKHWIHEGGIATPLIAYWPATIQKAALTQQPGHIIDIMATCVDLAGATYPKTYKDKPITPLEGVSLAPIFEGKTRAGHEFIFWEHEGNRAVRQGKWKLVALHKGAWELYDLETDRTELHNLAAEHPDKVKEMATKYDDWAARCGVQLWEKVSKGAKP
jgi:arylsulfatase A-like enzyme